MRVYTVEAREFLGKQAVDSLSGRGRIRQKRWYYMPDSCISGITDGIEEGNIPRPRL